MSKTSIEKNTTSYGVDFIRRFEQAYGLPETGNYAIVLTYAAFFALHTALESGTELQQTLSSMEFNSRVNGNFRFEKNGITNSFSSSEENAFAENTLKIIRNGEPVDFKRVERKIWTLHYKHIRAADFRETLWVRESALSAPIYLTFENSAHHSGKHLKVQWPREASNSSKSTSSLE